MSDTVYKIDANEDTPLFLFDKDLCRISIKGVSMPENAFEFYDPIEKMLLENSCGSPVLEIELLYMNSMSNKQLLKLIKQLATKSPTLKVIWKYAKGDSLIKNKGEEICSICAPAQVIVEESV